VTDLAGKEYSKADSRYIARDPTVVIIEGITAVLAGPGCLLAVYALLSTWFAITYTVCLLTQRVLFAFSFCFSF
jgi:cholestenol delta-isomerase